MTDYKQIYEEELKKYYSSLEKSSILFEQEKRLRSILAQQYRTNNAIIDYLSQKEDTNTTDLDNRVALLKQQHPEISQVMEGSDVLGDLFNLSNSIPLVYQDEQVINMETNPSSTASWVSEKFSG